MLVRDECHVIVRLYGIWVVTRKYNPSLVLRGGFFYLYFGYKRQIIWLLKNDADNCLLSI